MIKKIVVILLLISITYLPIGCADTNNNTIVKSIQSPNGKYIAYLFIRDLGATTKASNQLSIYKEGKTLGDSGGNIFVTYGDFDINWSNDVELKVNITSSGEVFTQEYSYKNIVIKYIK